MTCRDAIILARGGNIAGFYRGDPVQVAGRRGLVLTPGAEITTVLWGPYDISTVETASLQHVPA